VFLLPCFLNKSVPETLSKDIWATGTERKKKTDFKILVRFSSLDCRKLHSAYWQTNISNTSRLQQEGGGTRVAPWQEYSIRGTLWFRITANDEQKYFSCTAGFLILKYEIMIFYCSMHLFNSRIIWAGWFRYFSSTNF
jgi:hypothetical protein